MDKIGFIGVHDKTDFIVQIAKLLTEMGKRVLVVDTSLIQKAKYIIPVISPTKSYVTEFEEIDVAVGIKSPEQIADYLGVENIEILYDIALIDIDTPEVFEDFNMYEAKINYFVTSFDMYSLKRGLEALANLSQEIRLKKILFAKLMLQEDDDYLNFLSSNLRILWTEEKIYFPYELGDQSVIMENQRVAKVKLRNLSPQYKEGLLTIADEILDNTAMGNLRKILKNIEKSV